MRIVIKIDGVEDVAGIVVRVSREDGPDRTSPRRLEEPAAEAKLADIDAGSAAGVEEAVTGSALISPTGTPADGPTIAAEGEPATDAGPAPAEGHNDDN